MRTKRKGKLKIGTSQCWVCIGEFLNLNQTASQTVYSSALAMASCLHGQVSQSSVLRVFSGLLEDVSATGHAFGHLHSLGYADIFQSPYSWKHVYLHLFPPKLFGLFSILTVVLCPYQQWLINLL